MIVELIAHTVLSNLQAMHQAGYEFHPYTKAVTDADELAEFAGRLCYESWHRPNPATAENDGYIANILDHQHYSVLEHSSATFYIEGVSRSLTHELVRHRHLSFSQVSQRYVDSKNVEMVEPTVFVELGKHEQAAVKHAFTEARELYAALVDELTHRGLKRKEARQAARAVLPNATATKLVITGNMRAWRDVISKRNSPHADVEIRELAQHLLANLKIVAPAAFQDMP
jgi:thymidylate synthase (FAD)